MVLSGDQDISRANLIESDNDLKLLKCWIVCGGLQWSWKFRFILPVIIHRVVSYCWQDRQAVERLLQSKFCARSWAWGFRSGPTPPAWSHTPAVSMVRMVTLTVLCASNTVLSFNSDYQYYLLSVALIYTLMSCKNCLTEKNGGGVMMFEVVVFGANIYLR